MEDNYWCPEYGANRYYPINVKPPLPTRGRPTLKPGDIVKWKTEPWWTHKDVVGTVIRTRWTLMDWATDFLVANGKFYPEAQILWCNGETTNTHHLAVKRMNMSEKKPVRDFDDSEGRKKSPAAPKKRKKTV
jgi:hypothetical protein